MERRDLLVTGCASLTAAVSGCVDRLKYRNEPWVGVSVIPDNIIAGFDSEQVFEIFMHGSNEMGSKLPEKNREHQIRIDVSPLEQYGVDIENLSVETTQGIERDSDNYNNNIETVDLTDGVIDLVVRTSEDVYDTDPIALMLKGLQFSDLEAVTEIQYDVQSPTDHVEISNGVVNIERAKRSDCATARSADEAFKLIDPQLLPPTLYPDALPVNQLSQRLYIEWLTPEDDEVFVEIDISSLDKYGTVEEAAVETVNRRGDSDKPMIWGATLESLTIDDRTVSMKLTPDSGTNYASAIVRIRDINVTAEDPVEGLSYEMNIEDDAHETVKTESFDIIDAA